MKLLIKTIISFIVGLFLAFSLIYFTKINSAVAKTASDTSPVIQAGLDFLSSQQQADGGMLGFSDISDPDTTARSVLAFVIAGTSVNDVVSADGNSMLDYLSTQIQIQRWLFSTWITLRVKRR